MSMVRADQLARAGYTYIGRLYTEMDCQAFVEECLRVCGLKINLAGSNTWYRKMTWVGSPEECKARFGKIPVGAFLYILEQDGKEPAKYRGDGIGNASHIGIYTGIRQGAIHSSESRGSVQESRFSGKTIKDGWNRVGLWDQVAYDVDVNARLTEVDGMAADYMANVTGGRLSLRAGRSTSTQRLDWIPDGETVHVVEEFGEWKMVEWDGRTGYVLGRYLSAGEQAGESSGETDGLPSPVREKLNKIYDELGDLLGLRG